MSPNTLIYDGRVDRAAMIRFYEERTLGKINLIVNGHAIRVDELIKKSKLQGKDYNKFLDKLDLEISNMIYQTKQSSTRSLVDLFKDQSNFAVKNLDKGIGEIWKTEQPRRISEDFVLKKPLIGDATLEQGWSNIGKAERIRIDTIIRKGISLGQSEGAIADSVTKEAYGITKSQAKGLVVTATTSVYAQADHAVYVANAKAIAGWQFVSVLDSRTTPTCAGLDGKVFPVEDTVHLPPRHYHCRSTTVPIVKSYEDLSKLEGVAQIRKRNFAKLTPQQIASYDGQGSLKESYNQWLTRQPNEVVLRHLGDTKKLDLFRSGQLTVDKFTNPDGNSIGIKELNALTDSGYGIAGDTKRFALAKEKLDTIKLGAARPDEIYESPEITKALREYYLLQVGELDGTMSLTNYRGTLLHNKKATKMRVLASPPREEQMRFNPITGVYNDTRLYQPSPDTLRNTYKLVEESTDLKQVDKDFIIKFVDSLENHMSVNERAVITENLRITIGRQRVNNESWANLKAVLNGQVKFDVMNVSDYMETQLRKDANLLHKLKQSNYIDPVLGPIQLQDLHDNFISNIIEKNKWEDSVAPKIAKELKGLLAIKIPVDLRLRMAPTDIDNFYLKFARQLALADSPDRDQLAVSLGRDLYNKANRRGSRNEWYRLGVEILDDANDKGFYKLETFGVQKRRMKSRMGGRYFGPYYDTFAVNLRITDPRIQRYAKLTRKVELGLRIPSVDKNSKLYIRTGYKTYFADDGLLGFYDTRIPITSTSSFKNFPAEIVDKDMTDALNWSAKAEYKIDPEFHDAVEKILFFQDDKGAAQYYHDLNKYREFIIERGDAYERFKAMKWLRDKDAAFSNMPFLDHRGRIYERGLISPQSGESFRPFLNTAKPEAFSELGFLNLNDQLGSFLGGMSDVFEHKFNSLSVQGRQSIATYWRKDVIELGNKLRRAKPQDIRDILESKIIQLTDGEEQGKLMRLALEYSRINEFLGGNFDSASLKRLKNYQISLALEQDASSSGAQIIALTTKNKQLAELSNVVPTNSKKRLYDEIANTTFNDPRFRILNEKLGLSEKDLRKAAKNQNMVTLYGAGKKTGILAVESKLGKILGKPFEKPLSVIIRNRDTELETPAAKKTADLFYANLKERLEGRGYRVKFQEELKDEHVEVALWADYARDSDRVEFTEDMTMREYRAKVDQSATASRREADKLPVKQYLLSDDERRQIESFMPKAPDTTLVLKAEERDTVLAEISARMARYEKIDMVTYKELKALRQDVKDLFNKGLTPGEEIMEQLYFLDSKTRDLVEKMTRQYDRIITPDDFQQIAMIMSEHLGRQVPILTDFTKYYGRLAQAFLETSKPKNSEMDYSALLQTLILGERSKGKRLPGWLARTLAIKDESVKQQILRRIPGYVPGSPLSKIIEGVDPAKRRRTGFKIGKFDLYSEDITKGIEVGLPNKLDKSWTNVPNVNFDGKILEQNYTQVFEEKLMYKDADGKWVTNILQVPQKTEGTWWEEFRNKEGKINDIVDATRARTAYGVNSNHARLLA